MRHFLAVSLVLALLSTTAKAADKDTPRAVPPALASILKGNADDFLKRFDKNSDGYVTKDELPPRFAQAFDKADTNGDGKLDRAEIEQWLQRLRRRFGQENKPGAEKPDVDRMVASLLQRMDTNGDGKISRDEAQGQIAKNFDRIDTNKDGFLDKEELRKAAARFPSQRKSQPDAKANPTGPRIPDFDALDRNADGRLTRDELEGTPYAPQFDQMDLKKDGKITRKEFEAFFQALAQKAEQEPKK